ncbi:hypothetical protein HHK36_006431 [Tetracentron sinense]|uniref:DUF4283 domain-containing protein n=1 Tax=Tetracentron sinense TaxID=13715 RepID=A0A834ZHI1_TETSI|nr:hypothetical protein HHK36_006431 [Tetracentron sinense]
MGGRSPPRPPDLPKVSYAEAVGNALRSRLGHHKDFSFDSIKDVKQSATFQGEPALFYTAEELKISAAVFQKVLIAKFAYGRSSIEVLKNYIQGSFHTKLVISVGILDEKHLLIRFESEEDFISVWLKEFCYIEGQLVRFIKWTPLFQAGSEPTVVPIWISLLGLPINLFNPRDLKAIGNIVRRVLKVDGPTQTLSRPSVARLCVEIDVKKDKVERFWLGLGTIGRWQHIKYEKEPILCDKCHKIGHNKDDCRKGGKKSGIGSVKKKPKGMEIEGLNKEKKRGDTYTDPNAKESTTRWVEKTFGSSKQHEPKELDKQTVLLNTAVVGKDEEGKHSNWDGEKSNCNPTDLILISESCKKVQSTEDIIQLGVFIEGDNQELEMHEISKSTEEQGGMEIEYTQSEKREMEEEEGCQEDFLDSVADTVLELKMRAIVWAVRHVRSASRLREGDGLLSGLDRTLKYLVNPVFDSSYKPLHNDESERYLNFCIISRALYIPTAKDTCGGLSGSTTDVGRAGPLVEYERRIGAGELVDGDSCQVDTLRELQRLYDELVESADACRLDRYAASEKAGRSRWLWSRLMPQFSYSPVKGLYLFGGVGTGKTMLMDLFFDQLPPDWRKKRIHFHDFMLNVHSRLQKHKGVADPLEVVAGEISDESILLCLDEFMVTDVADALILNRLFRHLFNNGVILVSTSNRAPDNLYEGGLQRDLFLPFIATLKERCIVHEIGSSTDYRKMTSAEQGFYFVGEENSNLLKQKFQQLIGEYTASPQEAEVIMGRKLQVPLAANGCAYFPFEDLCDKPLGAADYFGLFIMESGHHAVMIVKEGVMYENKGRLLCTAEGTPTQLFERIVTVSDAQHIAPRTSSRSRKSDDFDLCVDNELGFAKDRTISRLTEMNSREFLEQHAVTLAGKQLSQEDASEDASASMMSGYSAILVGEEGGQPANTSPGASIAASEMATGAISSIAIATAKTFSCVGMFYMA